MDKWQKNWNYGGSVGCSGMIAVIIAVSLLTTALPAAADSLNWNTSQNRVSAEIKGAELLPVLENIAAATGWRVFVEADTIHNRVSASFKDAKVGEALHLLLGNVNYALVPQTTGSSKLFVFQTSQANATMLVRANRAGGTNSTAKVIPNELIVRLKPGAKIESIRCLVGTNVLGHIDNLNAYRLRFEDAAATEAARKCLSSNSDVTSVDSNYSLDRPPSPTQLPAGSSAPASPHLTVKAPPDSGKVIVGLVDTAVQTMCDNNNFLLSSISVAGTAQTDQTSPSHGTAMAETMMRSINAVTKGKTSVQILPVDVYGPNATTSTFDVANGIVTAVTNGAKIINLSLGSDSDSSFLHSVIQDASSQNILFLGAAGNSPVTTPFYPAAYKEVLGVTAIDQGQLASYANRGSFISLGAPGNSIVCYDGQSYAVSGTSASSAYASGVAAGYMDSSGSTTSQAQSFLLNNLGVTISGGSN